MPKVDFITHQGVRILVLDVSHTKNIDENIAAFNAGRELATKEPPKSVRLMTDVTQAHYTAEGVEVMKEFSKAVTPHIKASAVVGVSGIKRIIVQSIIKLTGRNIEILGSREKALDWLAGQL
jgi:hypothetical protein